MGHPVEVHFFIFLMASQRQYQQNQMDSVLRNTSCGTYNLYTQIRTVIKTCASEEEPEPCWASLLTTLLDIKMTNFGSWKLLITTLDDVNVITNIITMWNHITDYSLIKHLRVKVFFLLKKGVFKMHFKLF